MRPRDTFLGTGWGFPPTFEKSGNNQLCGVKMVSQLEDIQESLTILFSTRLNERVMRPQYGGSLEELLFEPINESLVTYVKDLITNSILYYEPRIDLENIEIQTANAMEGQIKVILTLTVRTTNSRFNFVYDYYLLEGTIAPI